MDRRGFLKRCSLIPFVGSLAAVAKTETPKVSAMEAVCKLDPSIEGKISFKLFCLKCGNPEHAEIPGARAWLDECEDVVNIDPMVRHKIKAEVVEAYIAFVRRELRKYNFPREFIS